jgi:hypothetical protein
MNSTEDKEQGTNSTNDAPIRLKTKESFELICKRCKTHFDSMDNVVYRGTNRYKGHSVCPKCDYHVPVMRIVPASGYERTTTGQYVREVPKIHMSKKERRRR